MGERRSSILMHWTGKGVTLDLESLTDEDRRSYVALLGAILRNGLRLSLCREHVSYVAHETSPEPGRHHTRGWSPKITCFTELRVSRARNHAARYGLMGIGFDRRWVLERHGAPVHYVRGRDSDVISERLGELLSWFSQRGNEYYGKAPDKHKDVMDRFRSAYEILAFTKPMSSPVGEEDFTLMEEHEWRIVQIPRVEHDGAREGYLGTDGDLRTLLIKPTDVRVFVFPDDATRRMAISDPHVSKFLGSCDPGRPTLMTIDEAEQM